MLNSVIFLWLGSQPFYRNIWQKLLEQIEPLAPSQTSWLDVGCNVGHLCRIAHTQGFQVTGLDIDTKALKFAKLLSNAAIHYTQELKNDEKFHIITAHSLLSVVDNKVKMLQELHNYKQKEAQLIIIEPTEKLTLANVSKQIHSPSSFWYYKGLLLWAFFRQGKAIDINLLGDARHLYLYDEMIRISFL